MRNNKAILTPLIHETDLHAGIAKLVDQIVADFEGDELYVIGLLRGSFMFTADLVRLLHRRGIRMVIDFMSLASYGSNTVSSGTVDVIRDVHIDLTDKPVLLVDDILDTGRTLDFASRHLQELKLSSLKTCVFLDKPSRRVVPFEADYVGFTIEDLFVVGYGLDYDGRYRELPYLSVIKDD